MNQCHLFDYIPKDRSTNFLNALPKDILEEALQRVKDGCNEIIKDYNEYVKDITALNKKRKKYGMKLSKYTRVYCTSPGFAYRYLEQYCHFPAGFIDECIARGVLVKDDIFGFIFNENWRVNNGN